MPTFTVEMASTGEGGATGAGAGTAAAATWTGGACGDDDCAGADWVAVDCVGTIAAVDAVIVGAEGFVLSLGEPEGACGLMSVDVVGNSTATSSLVSTPVNARPWLACQRMIA
jgi:hypothetical protein